MTYAQFHRKLPNILKHRCWTWLPTSIFFFIRLTNYPDKNSMQHGNTIVCNIIVEMVFKPGFIKVGAFNFTSKRTLYVVFDDRKIWLHRKSSYAYYFTELVNCFKIIIQNHFLQYLVCLVFGFMEITRPARSR